MGHQTCLLFFFPPFYWFLPLDPGERIIPETNRQLTHLFLFALGSGVVTTTFLPSPRTCHGFPANIFAPDCTSFYFFVTLKGPFFVFVPPRSAKKDKDKSRITSKGFTFEEITQRRNVHFFCLHVQTLCKKAEALKFSSFSDQSSVCPEPTPAFLSETYVILLHLLTIAQS